MNKDEAWAEARRRWPHCGALVAVTRDGRCYVSNEYNHSGREWGEGRTWEEAFADCDRRMKETL